MPHRLEKIVSFLEILYNSRDNLFKEINQQPDEHGRIQLPAPQGIKSSLSNKNGTLELDYTKHILRTHIEFKARLTPNEIKITLTNNTAVTDLTYEHTITLISIKDGKIDEANITTSFHDAANPAQNWSHEAKIPPDDQSRFMNNIMDEVLLKIPKVQNLVSDYNAEFDSKLNAFFQEVNTEGVNANESTPSISEGVEEIIRRYTR